MAIEFVYLSFNRSEPTYKSQCIKLLDVISAFNQLNVNALNMWKGHLIFGEDRKDHTLLKVNFSLHAMSAFRETHYSNIFLMFLYKLNTMEWALSIIQL